MNEGHGLRKWVGGLPTQWAGGDRIEVFLDGIDCTLIAGMVKARGGLFREVRSEIGLE